MELDFDNEIDALLRKEAAGRTITIGEFAGMHLDADEIAAFAEGAVPEGARLTFVRHFADCDACRRTLSGVVALRPAEAEEAVGHSVSAPAAAVPWYRRFFVFPNLAYVMGGLVVLFAGFIGLSVLTGTYRSGQSEVSSTRSAEPEDSDFAEQPAMSTLANTNSSANSAMNAASNAANTAANAPGGGGGGSALPLASPAGNTALAKEAPITAPADDLRAEAPRQVTAAPPPAPPKENGFTVDGVDSRRARELRAEPQPERDSKKAEDKKDSVETTSRRSGPTPKLKGPTRNDRAERNLALEAENAPSPQKAANPRSAPAPGTPAASTAGKKNVSGRTFEFRQGAWYDTTYRGQGTINVRRNTDDYRKLDSGLRGIAESFIGTVVVTIWNGRAYRIQ